MMTIGQVTTKNKSLTIFEHERRQNLNMTLVTMSNYEAFHRCVFVTRQPLKRTYSVVILATKQHRVVRSRSGSYNVI